METLSLKSLAAKRLQGSQQGNRQETPECYTHIAENSHLQKMETEYFSLLCRAFELNDPKYGEAGFQELTGLVVELDKLYRELNRQGRKVPLRLPVENKAA